MFRSTSICFIIVFSLFLLSFSGLGVGDKQKVQLFVDDDAPSSWYDDTHFSNIQDAIENASDGSIIFVYEGTYFGEMTVNKSVELIGMNAQTTIIDGIMVDNVLEIRADDVKIQSLTISNSSRDGWQHEGIGAEYVKNLAVLDCLFVLNTDGIRLREVDQCSIMNCCFEQNLASAITVFPNATNITIDSCLVRNNGAALANGWTYFGGIAIGATTGHGGACKHIKIKNSSIVNNNGYGIHLRFTCDAEIKNNNISDNAIGAIQCLSEDSIAIKNNTIFNNKEFGITVHGDYYTLTESYSEKIFIEENNIIKNGNEGGMGKGGIYIQDCYGEVEIKNNLICNHENYGLMLHRSYLNNITGNIFEKNSNHTTFRYFMIPNLSFFSLKNNWNKNYWDNGFGIGPKAISGKLYYPSSRFICRWINFDWAPQKINNDISNIKT